METGKVTSTPTIGGTMADNQEKTEPTAAGDKDVLSESEVEVETIAVTVELVGHKFTTGLQVGPVSDGRSAPCRRIAHTLRPGECEPATVVSAGFCCATEDVSCYWFAAGIEGSHGRLGRTARHFVLCCSC